MLDIESALFSEISSALRERFAGIYVTGEYVSTPAQFPCVSLVEADSPTFKKTMTSSGENHIAVMYELNVYSNKKTGKKSECKEIAGFVSDLLSRRNFTRTMLQPIPNLNDPTVYRMVGRYEAVVGKDNILYRR